MTLLASLMAFLATPAGQALVAVVPTLAGDIIAIWHKSGAITTEDLANYLATSKPFDVLVPKKG